MAENYISILRLNDLIDLRSQKVIVFWLQIQIEVLIDMFYSLRKI